jgi:hypothetical protein
MKKIILYALLLVIPAVTFSQQTTGNMPALKTDYLQKSKNQKTAAWILLTGGAVLSSIGAVVIGNEVVNDIGGIFDPTIEPSSNTGTILSITGTAAMLGSIPLFISSAKNKRKAMSASAGIKMEKLPVIRQTSFVQNSYPAVSIKISL